MNLHEIVSGAIGTVNPHIPATLKTSTGYVTADDGSRTPTYAQKNGMLQVQGLSERELRQMNGLNIAGILRKVYLDGDWHTMVRDTGDGGDLFVFDTHTWKIVHVMETWPDWSHVIVAQQVAP
jgi:hypothetical protein